MEVKSTHRGVVIPYEILKKNSGLLFGGEAPNLRKPGKYSFAWSGQFVGDNTFENYLTSFDAKTVPEIFEKFSSERFNAYKGAGQNALFADTQGNIGYHLLMSYPERKDKTPYVATRILDGTTSKFDWTGEIVPLRDLPKSLNPAKGYIVSANGRQTSDHAMNDLGATVNCPARTLRIDEMLREGIAVGKKFTLEDMAAIQ